MTLPAPSVTTHGDTQRRAQALQVWRRWTQAGFFVLFLLAPSLNLLRFDLHETQLWVLGMRWSLGIDGLLTGQISATQAGLNLLWRVLLPAVLLVGLLLGLAYRHGRIYCGWLCPHFSMVEMLNSLLHRACGKLSLWDRAPVHCAGVQPRRRWWPLFALSCLASAFVWAITLLTYLLPPQAIWTGLFTGTLTPNQLRFLLVGTALFTAEFAFARHLFCRFGCAVGLFQSLAWMANPRGLVVAFERERARDCRTCQSEQRTGPAHAALAAPEAPLGNACDSACPMRLQPRHIKRRMFSCVQCGQCLSACDTTQSAQQRSPTLRWRIGEDALRETLRQRRAQQREPH